MEQALNNLVNGVANVFAGKTLHFNNAYTVKTVGGMSASYDFAFAPGYNNIFHNAHGLIRLHIDRKDGSGQLDINDQCPIEVETILFDYRYRDAGVKFRKINAKNIHEAVKKIIAWMEKNAEAMQAIDFK